MVTELRLPLLPGAAHIQTIPCAKAAGELPVDEYGEAAVDAVGCKVIGRAHDVDHRFNETRLVRAQRFITERRRRRDGRAGRLR